MKRNLKFVAAVLCGLLCLAAAQVVATPIVSLHTQADWEAALTDGRIQPVLGPVFEAMVQQTTEWPDEYQRAEFFTPQVYATQQPFDGEDALVMAWDAPAASDYGAAAWDYVYPEDPDLSGMTMSFSIYPPWPSTFFSLNVVDANDPTIWREFIWHASGNPGDPIPGQWNTVTINPGAGTGTFSPQVFTIGNFDITNVGTLRFDENVPFPPPSGWNPPNPFPPPGLPLVNLWNHVEVSPEPGTLIVWSTLIGLGLAYGWRRRRR